jgi:transposase
MDETPLKAGRREKGKLQTGYLWPIYGDQDEAAFPFAASRAPAVVREALGTFCGVLLTEGYRVYERFTQKVTSIRHAQGWSHTRRPVEKAANAEPRLVAAALDRIATFDKEEAASREQGLAGAAKLAHRGEYTNPLVEDFFAWLNQTVITEVLLPSNPFGHAARYAREREAGLKVFLANPDVPLDTTQLEREIRPIALGRKSRVGEEITPLTPRRPGRADFPHPVLHWERSLKDGCHPKVCTIRGGGKGKRSRRRLNFAHVSLWRPDRRLSHFCQIRGTW